MEKIALLLGGDLGHEEEYFARAAELFAAGGVRITARSRLYVSPPWNCDPGTPDFRNQALTGMWAGTPEELLSLCQNIERAAGRPENHSSRRARVLDCDIILMGDRVQSTENLTLPHPRARQRGFVLQPLAEIAGFWCFPDTGESVLEALAALPEAERGAAKVSPL